MFIDNNVIAPMSAPMRAMYRDKKGVEHIPSYICVVDGEWYDQKAIKARKKQGLNVTPDK